VSVSADHNIWVLAKKETATAKPFLRVNDTECTELALPAGNTWEWVSGKSGKITEYLAAGNNSFNFSVDGGAVLMDKVLVTNDLECVPEGDGGNCVKDQLEYFLDGVNNGDIISSPVPIKVNILSNTPNATIQFYLNGTRIGEQTSAPYCLVAGSGSTCGSYDFFGNGYAEGSYTLSVVGTVEGQESVEQSRTFTLKNPIPAQSPAPSPPPATTQKTLTLSVDGIADNETVSGAKTVKATVSDGTNVKVDFYINDRLYSSDTSAPFCMVNGTGNSCGNWDSQTVNNGNYTLGVTASASDAKSASKAIKISINNKAPVASETPKKQEIVVGVANQQASGIVRVTVPASRTANASTVTYKVNDKPVETVPATSPATTIDTSQYSNGNAAVTATINKTNGEKEVLQSSVKVRNDAITSSSSWFKEHIVMTMLFLVLSSVGLFLFARFAISWYQNRQLEEMHNLTDAYTYVQPQETAYQTQAAGGLAAFLFATVGVLSVVQFGSSAVATRLGFISEMETGTRPSQYVIYDDPDQRVYVRLDHTEGSANPSPAPNPTPTSANILNETFEGRGQSISNGTKINGDNTFARLNYEGIPVSGFCIYDMSPCYTDQFDQALPAFDSSVKISGQYSGKFSITSVGRDIQAGSFYHQSFDRTTTAYARFWWRFDDAMANAGGNPSLMHWRGDYGQGPQYADIRLGASKTLNLSNHDGSGGVNGSYQYAANTWYDVSLELDGPSGLSRLVVRDQQGNQLQDTTHYYQSGGDIGFIEFGVLGGYSQNYNSLASMWYDDVRMSTDPIDGNDPTPTPNPTPTPSPTPTPPPTPTPTPTPNPTPTPSGSTFSTDFNSCSTITACGFYVLPPPGPHDFAYPGSDGSAFGPVGIYGGAAHAEGAQRESVVSAPITTGANQFAEATITVGPAWGDNDYTGVTVRTQQDSATGHYAWYKFEIFGGSTRIASLFYEPNLGRHGFNECSGPGGIYTNSVHKLRLEVYGQTLIGLIDGTPVIHCVDNSVRAISSGGAPGLHLQGANMAIDDFNAGPLTGGVPYSNLPAAQEFYNKY
jgi:hypothetical protein